jgi:hypothetical protein
MLKAWLSGTAVLVLVYGGWALLLQLELFSRALALALWVAPLVAGFVAAALTPSYRLLIGTSMALPAAFLALLLNVGMQTGGAAVDFPGPRGGVVLFTLVLLASAVAAVIGSLAARLITGDKA